MDKQSFSSAEMSVIRDQQLTQGRKNYFVVGPPCLTAEQIARLKAIADTLDCPAEFVEAGVEYVTGARYQDDRRTQVCSLDPVDHRWIYEIVWGCFTAVNQLMRYDIVPSMSDPIQLLRYDAAEQGHFRWHADTLPSDMTRKISLVVPLSEAGEYEGGATVQPGRDAGLR